MTPTANSCQIYYIFLPIGTLVRGLQFVAHINKLTFACYQIFLYAADILLAYRALCLWRMNRTLLAISSALFVASVITSTVLVSLSISQFFVKATPPYLTGCFTTIPDYSFASPIPGTLDIGQEATLLILMMPSYRIVLRILDFRIGDHESDQVLSGERALWD